MEREEYDTESLVIIRSVCAGYDLKELMPDYDIDKRYLYGEWQSNHSRKDTLTVKKRRKRCECRPEIL